ncbi:stress response protein CsbD [Ameyamaea chiangmaiensis NBRC 103196]|uniref:CsbD family protein n=1 Tax=Ameyamaea chiangmaiensis TaxID=442969 RepID=A0A850PD29_9PROT|nr:CsbD family protein [Ameyamaea chiangmaiensis]MBS4074687.1 CsbD family protein [Ameyamaea chiangmaiensis]NVN40410.1 CsbD family protein [Ameyamaea chiangmaiensis]GBQ62367.1 stress response protein CsbD [Ameyamaea chiangmaiensis NBRC 103196]
MSSMMDKVKGAGNSAMGKVKEEYGKGTNNPEVEAEGLAQQVKGKAQTTKGKIKDHIEKL